MAKNAKAESELITLGEFVSRLGISQPTWNNHPEYREFLDQQDGVVFKGKRGQIPENLVSVVAERFNIQPSIRNPRGPRKPSTRNRGVDYSTLDAEQLLEHKAREEALLADGHDYTEDIRDTEKNLQHLRAKQEEFMGAQNRLENIQKALDTRKAVLEAKAAAIAQEKALLESLNA